jgi:hypothetical protein
VTDSIKQIAKIRKLTSNDFTKLLGRPCEGLGGTEKVWFGKWQKSIGSVPFANDVEFSVWLSSYDSGEYVIAITEHRTYRSGLKYLRWNLAKAFNRGSFIPLESYHEYEEERLEFTYPD